MNSSKGVALVTGISGFVGPRLARRLTESGYEVHGLARSWSASATVRPMAARVHVGDVLSRESVEAIVEAVRPSVLFHLAGESFPADSWTRPKAHLDANTMGTLNVIEAVRRIVPKARLILGSSGEVYGYGVTDGVPVTESNVCQPATPYAVSKLAADLLGQSYFLRYGVDVVRLRLFNHTGPGQRDAFVLPSFSRQIVDAEMGRGPNNILCGNLDVERCFTDVQDIVIAYELAATHGRVGGCYNVGRKTSHGLRELAGILASMARVPVTFVQDPGRTRPGELRSIRCDSGLFVADTGWEPRVPMSETLSDLLEFWRGQ